MSHLSSSQAFASERNRAVGGVQTRAGSSPKGARGQSLLHGHARTHDRTVEVGGGAEKTEREAQRRVSVWSVLRR
jgi:hypothetical protein